MSDTATPTAPPVNAANTLRAIAPDAPRGKTFEIDCQLAYQVNGPSDFLFQIHALNGMDQQVVSESLVVTPNVPLHIYADPTIGHRFLRLHADAGPLSLHYQAQVRRTPVPVDPDAAEVPIAQLPDELMHNLNPTRYCESDHLGQAAQKIFADLPHGYARVQGVVDWIHANIEYRVGSSQATTTARDVFVNRAGVCRDFAHLGVTFCRALNIPARLVVGYANFDEPPPDFHAVFEAYIGGRWVMFDATQMSPVDELVRIATGRDAKDVAFATIFGPATMSAMSPLIKAIA
ncbi:MAG: transglutaminase family protein [Pseudomonadota bacterium]